MTQHTYVAIDLKSFYAQFRMMIDKRYNNSESSVAFSVKIESEKTIQYAYTGSEQIP